MVTGTPVDRLAVVASGARRPRRSARAVRLRVGSRSMTDDELRRGADARCTSPLHDRHVALGRQDRRVRRLGDAAGVRRSGVVRSTPRCATPSASSTSATSARRWSGPGCGRVRQRHADQRPRPDHAGQGAVHPVLRRRDRRHRRRPDRLPARDEQVFLIPNAANTAEVVRRLRRGARRRRGDDQHETYAVLAVQGRAPTRCSRRSGCRRPRVHVVRRGRPSRAPRSWCAAPATPASAATSWSRRTTRPARCGTRCSPPGSRSACCRAASAPATRCAPRWATRCTARTSASTSRPVQARLGWAVGWNKDAFWGKDALVAEKEARPGPAAARAGRHRPGHPAARHAGAARRRRTRSGEITSGTFSPTLRTGHRAGADRAAR